MERSSAPAETKTNENLISSIAPVDYVTVPFNQTSSKVGFVDVGPREGPVVIALHGAPGGVQDFAELYGPLADRGIRFIVPEFPGFGRTTVEDAKAFDESTLARVNLVTNFLKVLNIKRVTSVLGHSMGAAAAFHLAANSDIVKSVIYVNGVGFSPQGNVRPYWLTCLWANLLENSWTKPVISYFLSSAYALKGYDTSKISMGMNVGIISVSRLGFEKHRENISRVKDKRLPVLSAFSKNDRLIEWNLPMEVVQFLETPDESISWFDSDEQLVNGRHIDNDTASFPWAVVFERGGHFVHRSHLSVMVTCIARFIERVHFASESQM